MLKPYRTISAIQEDLKLGSVTCNELVEYYLQNIENNKHLNAFVDVYADEALEQARIIDEKVKNGTAGRLAGAVIGLKDVISYKDHSLQAGSKILSGYNALYNATVVDRLLSEDAIIIGRQNCDEFAMGSSNESSSFGPVSNAADVTKVPGGSSGGSAVAVQADLCHASLGSDTGGSVRQPASFCGTVGLKPSYGRVSRWGLIAYASSFDSIGPITKSVDDAALLLEVIAGADEYDSTVSSKEVPSYSTTAMDVKPLRIGYLKEGLDEKAVQEEVRENTQNLLDKLKSEGHVVEEVNLPLVQYILPTYYILTTAEASSNLSRFDGVRYGHRSTEVTDLESLYKKTRSEGFGAEVKRRILLGTFVLSASYYDAYYTKAQRVRQILVDKTKELLNQYDFIVSPVAPTTAFKIGEKMEDPLQMYLADIFTVQANLIGFPAISIPNGEDKEGMPVGVQVMAGAFEEQNLLAFGKYIESL